MFDQFENLEDTAWDGQELSEAQMDAIAEVFELSDADDDEYEDLF